MFRLFYNLAMQAYSLMVLLMAPFHKKAGLFVSGRKNQINRIKNFSPGTKVVWFHAASLGEFEQGKPVMERLKEMRPDIQLVVTFFSPSGYEIRKDYPHAEVFYLPVDTPRNARDFVSAINPVLAVFVRYEFWLNYYSVLHEKAVPTVVIAAQFQPGQFIFSSWARWMLVYLKRLDLITHQYQSSSDLLIRYGFDAEKQPVCGDSRFDRVLNTRNNITTIEKIKKFKGNDRLLVMGSCYGQEEKLVFEALKNVNGWKVLIAPHHIDEQNIQRIIAITGHAAVRFTDEEGSFNGRFMILNTMGMLASAYHYADIAVVGGGFKKGIHNILEPAAFGATIFFGPEHQNFPEAGMLLSRGLAFEFNQDGIAIKKLKYLLQNSTELQERQANVRAFVEEHAGATACITENLSALIGVS